MFFLFLFPISLPYRIKDLLAIKPCITQPSSLFRLLSLICNFINCSNYSNCRKFSNLSSFNHFINFSCFNHFSNSTDGRNFSSFNNFWQLQELEFFTRRRSLLRRICSLSWLLCRWMFGYT